jgi:hypothetical protein
VVSNAYREKPPSSAMPRLFAVLALAACAGALIAVVAQSGDSGGPAGSTQLPTTASTSHPKDAYYVVKSGDTLASIAAHENVPQARLERLNPKLDPFGLQPLNCVNVVAGGCKKLAQKNAG